MLGRKFGAARPMPATSVLTLVFFVLASGAVFAAGKPSGDTRSDKITINLKPDRSSMSVSIGDRKLATLPVDASGLQAANAHRSYRSRRHGYWYDDGCEPGRYYGYYGRHSYHSPVYGYSPAYGYYGYRPYRPAPQAELTLETGKQLQMVALPGDIDSVTTASVAGAQNGPIVDRWRYAQPDTAQRGAVDIVISRRPELEMMAEIQRGLNMLGYKAGPEDGTLGPLTSGAVKRFQKSNGLKVDGVTGPQTLDALHAALGPKAPKPAVVTVRRDGEIIERFDVALASPGTKLGNHVLLREQANRRFMPGWRLVSVGEKSGISGQQLFGLAGKQSADLQANSALARITLSPGQSLALRNLAGGGSTLVITDHAIEAGGMQLASK